MISSQDYRSFLSSFALCATTCYSEMTGMKPWAAFWRVSAPVDFLCNPYISHTLCSCRSASAALSTEELGDLIAPATTIVAMRHNPTRLK